MARKPKSTPAPTADGVPQPVTGVPAASIETSPSTLEVERASSNLNANEETVMNKDILTHSRDKSRHKPLNQKDGDAQEAALHASSPQISSPQISSPSASLPLSSTKVSIPYMRLVVIGLCAGSIGGGVTGYLIPTLFTPSGFTPAGVVSSSTSHVVQPASNIKIPDFDALFKTRDEKQTALESRLRIEIDKLTKQIATLRQSASLTEAETAAHTAPLPRHTEMTEKLTTLQDALAKLEQTATAHLRYQIAISRQTAVMRLSDAFETGKPLKPLLETLKARGLTPAQLEPFSIFETEGAPSLAIISQEFATMHAKISASLAQERATAEKLSADQHKQEKPANPSTGSLESLRATMEDAFTLIKQKAVGLVDIRSKKDNANKPEPHILDSALAKGEYRTALTLLDALPEGEKKALITFRSRLEALSKAREGLQELLQETEKLVQSTPLPSLP